MDLLEKERRKLAEALSVVAEEDGARASRIPGVTLLRAAQACRPVPVLYEPCIVVVAQGSKRFHLPDRVVDYSPRHFLAVTLPIPADCETLVGPDGPFLGFAVRIDLDVVGELLAQLGPTAAAEPPCAAGVVTAHVNAALSSASLRLVQALANDADARVLGPQFVREFLYRVLRSPAGGALRALLLGNESRTRIHRILERMHLEYAAPLDLPTLAHEAGMSASALHFHFRAVTRTSPIQYLKTLRLHKARMLMVQSSMNAAIAAERVGYGSASQFSREFKRLFGAPPAVEAQRVRSAFGFTDAVSAPF